MAAISRFETIAAVPFGSIEWPILAKAAFRPLSGLSRYPWLSDTNQRT
jgi:hypothetical protein